MEVLEIFNIFWWGWGIRMKWKEGRKKETLSSIRANKTCLELCKEG